MASKREGHCIRFSRNKLRLAISLEIQGQPVCAQVETPNVPTRLADVVPLAQKLADKIIECTSRSAAKPITCRKGCAACCRYLVPLSVPEALDILERIDQTPRSQACQLQRRFLRAAERLISSVAAEKQSLSTSEPKSLSRWYHGLAIDCPFLDGETCTIYSNRPIACREHLTTDPAELCRQPQPEKGTTLTMPFSISQVLARLAARLEQSPPEAVMLPLVLPWAEANRHRGRRTWPAKQVYGEFATLCQSLAASASPPGPAESAA